MNNQRRMEELSGERNVDQPGSASSSPYVPGEGAAREGNLADRPEVGTGTSERKRARELEPPEGPRMAKTLKMDEVGNEKEPVDMEDDKDEDLAEAVCWVAGDGDGMRR